MKHLKKTIKETTWMKFIHLFCLSVFVLLMAGIGTLPLVAQSPPNLDGRLDSLYLSHGIAIDYESFYAGATATLYIVDDTSIDSNYIWIAWVINKNFNDNSYGINRHSSWPKGHDFDDLLESDMQRLDLENLCGETVLDATMDYIDGPPYHAAYSTISGYSVDMDATESVKTYINGGDWSKMAYCTSLVANLNEFGYCTAPGDCDNLGTDLLLDSPPWSDEPGYIPAAAYNNWEYSLIFELRLDRSVFVTGACPGGGLQGVATNPVELHASPSKSGVNSITLFRAVSSIGDYVWLDVDRDGIQDVTESGIANVTLALYTDPNGDGDPSDGYIIATTTTDSNGHYIFSQIGSGNYVVEVTDENGILSGFSLTTGSINPHGPISLSMEESYLHADFGYAPGSLTTGAIGDIVWSDADNDGMQDPGEAGIGGVTLQLLADYDGDGNFTDVVANTTTRPDGSYLFNNLIPGYYVVDVTDTAGVLTGYSLTTGPQSSSDPTTAIGVTGGAIYLNADFGYYKPGLGISGNLVWFELDGNGVYDAASNPEHALDGVTVVLIQDTNGNGMWDTGEMIIATTTTVDGTYQFSGLSLDDGDGDADYLVFVTDNNDILGNLRKSTGPSPGADNNSQDLFYHIELSSASPSNQTADFGYYLDYTAGLIGDRVWYDLDGDGIQDTGEPGIMGVEVELWQMKNGIPKTLIGKLTTDANGYYYFPNLAIGSSANNGIQYAVIVSAENFLSGGVLGNYIPTNQPDNQDESEILTSTVNEDLSLDFGYRLNATNTFSIGDLVWWDSDGDGFPDASETGFANVTIVLIQDLDGDGVADDGEPVIAEDITDANGNYLFSGIGTGDYIVQITDENGILSGYTQTFGEQPQAVYLDSDNLTIDFGFNLAAPTIAFVSSFHAYASASGPVVQWETGLENGTVGFYLYRLEKNGSGKANYQQLNSNLLASLPATTAGAIYRYIDESIQPGNTYFYYLQEISAGGKKAIHGPFKVTVGYSQEAGGQLGIELEPLHGKFSVIPRSISPQRLERLRLHQFHLAQVEAQKSSIQVQPIAIPALDIPVSEEGLYFLDAGRIAALTGLPLDSIISEIDSRNFRLSNQGHEVTWFQVVNNAGIYFYGADIKSNYTKDNVYVLTQGKAQVATYADGGSPIPMDGAVYFDTLHFEKDQYAMTALFEDPNEDFWLWDYIKAGAAAKVFHINVPAVAPSDQATLLVHLQGVSDTLFSLDHHVVVSLNGTQIGEGRWDGKQKLHLELSVESSLFLDGDNIIEVSGKLDSPVPYSTFYVDSFDLTYKRYYRAENNKAIVSDQDNNVITIPGFLDPGINVFDITQPGEPCLLTGVTIDEGTPIAGGASTYRVSFVPATPGNRYLAVSAAGIAEPQTLVADLPSRLQYKTNSADYIVIYPAGFEAGAERLAGLRQNDGLETMTVQIEDIYDEFSNSIVNPHAIKDFLTFAYNEWLGQIPRYVVLIGEGTYDYKNVTGYSDNLVPPVMVKTPHGLFASDSWLGDVNGNDGVPEIAVGRIPVLTPAELAAYIDKLENYQGSGGEWTNRALLLADNADHAGNFPIDSNKIASGLSRYNVTKIYLPSFPQIEDLRQKTIEEIDQGVVLVNYIGHASLRGITQEGLLRNEDIELLDNGDRLPIFTAMTCSAGRFEVPGFDSFAERLLLHEAGGAVAMWSPTGLSFNAQARILDVEFTQAAFTGLQVTVGDAILQAMKAFHATGGSLFMMQIYNLLGDPAMLVK